MMVWLWSFIGILVLLILGLLFKIHMLRKAAGEIADGFADRLVTDTNTLIGISGRDRQMPSMSSFAGSGRSITGSARGTRS